MLRLTSCLGLYHRWIAVSELMAYKSVQLLHRVWLFKTPWTAAHQAFLPITYSWSLFNLMPIELVMTSNHLILCHPLLLLPTIFPSNRVFSNESVLCIRWPKHWSFSFSINEYSGLISFGMVWFAFLAVQGTLKNLLQHHSLKASNGTYKDQILGYFTSFLPCPKALALFLRYQ